MSSITRQERWYFGGVSGVFAACFTHPLDTLKVQLQTQQKANYGFVSMAVKIVRDHGFFTLYNGLSASCLRQGTWTTTRFAIYGGIKSIKPSSQLSFSEKILVAAGSGAIGAFVGAPADVVNVRMQNDCKLPKEQRRNYKHAFDGLIRIYHEEGPRTLFNGASMAVTRGALVTIGQIAFYEQAKQLLLSTGYFKDNVITHFSSSCVAGTIATLLTMPADVMKTRMMNAPPGTYNSLFDCFKDTISVGPRGLFKGFIPAFIRLGPQTILMFICLEQLKKYFGYMKSDKQQYIPPKDYLKKILFAFSK